MGAKLLAIYDIVTQKAGTNGRIQLAEKTGVPKVKAVDLEDDDKILKKFKTTASEIIGHDIDELL